MRADKYDPRYIERYSPRQIYEDYWDWLQSHPVWIINFVFGYLFYLASTEEI